MADVFNPTLAFNLGNIRAAGIVKMMLHIPTDAAYYSFGAPRDGKINLPYLSKVDTLLRPRSWGAMPDFGLTTFQSSLTELQSLTKVLINQPIDAKFQQSDGLWIVPSPSLGVRWSIISNGDFNDYRLINWLFKGALDKSEVAAIFTNSPPADGTPVGTDILTGLSQVATPANQKGNGFAKLEIKASGDSLYGDFDFREGKYQIDCLGESGGGGRNYPRTVTLQIKLDAICHQATAVEYGLMTPMVDNEIDLQVTHMDGIKLNWPNTNISLVPTADNVGNVDKQRDIKLHFEGAVVFDGTDFMCADGATAFSSLWS